MRPSIAKVYEALEQFAEGLPDEDEGTDMSPGMTDPSGEVEISVEAKPEEGAKTCPTCGHAMT